jgi:Aerotolerance regulator N-terminal/CARDB
MPSFLYPLPIALVAGLIALPIAIHLINLMRHRKVQWAAMEFLLLSQKRNHTWIMLKQLLLLLLRIGAIAAAVMMVTQPIVQNKLGGLFGGSKLHHIVLLDDSYSMSDHWADTTAFDEAKKFVQRLGKQAAQQPARQEFTLLRFSQTVHPARGTQADLAGETVDNDQFPKKLDQTLQALHTSELAVGPAEALKAAAQTIGDGGEANYVVFLVSDFRTKDWLPAKELQKLLRKLNEAGAKLQLINCVDEARPNLAIASLRPIRGTRAAGVPLEMEVTVHNYGAAPATNVSVRLEEQGTERPAIEIEKIDPGRSVTRQFEIRAQTAGQRRISAYLPADAVQVDNVRHTVIDFPTAVPVLIIDGGLKSGTAARESDGLYLESALSPPGPVPTGLHPRVEAPRFLDEHSLDEFQAIYLCNIDRLTLDAIDKLTKYVEAGGGVAFFVGDRTRADFTNQLYADGNGLFPVPLEAPVPLLVEQGEKQPDLQITDHPIFRIFSGENNPFIKMVNIEKYFAVKKGWKLPEGSATSIIAGVRNGAPLVVDKKMGDGRVLAFLTTAGPHWNNWGRDNPSYVVAMQELQSYLAAGRQTDPSRQVGTPLEIAVDTQKYQPQVEFLTPAEGTADRIVVKAEPQENGPAKATLTDTDTSGIYEVQLTANDNTQEVTDVAYNVDAAEGDLNVVNQEQLAGELSDVVYEYHRAGDLYFDSKDMQGFNLSESLLYVLIFLLLGEQLLAYLASYHPARLRGAS